MITRRGLVPFGVAALITLPAAALGVARPVFVLANLAVVAVLAADWWSARTVPLELERPSAGPFSIGRPNPAGLVVRLGGSRPAEIVVADAAPANADVTPLEHRVRLEPGEERTLALEVAPWRRGATQFPAIGVRVIGSFGFCFSQRRFPATATSDVTWPDVIQLRDEQMLLQGRSLGGLRLARAGDRGREFESLRAYVPGDEYRRISWKATARRGSPVVVNLQPERRQSLILAVETGRLMAGGGGARLGKVDRAVNACVMLAAAAREFDDAVGAISFDHRPHRALSPQARPGQVRRVVETLAGVEARLVEPDWGSGLAAIARLGTRRSLVVIFSDLHYVEAVPALAARIGTLTRRHAVVFASVVDHELTEQASQPIDDEASLYRRGTAMALMERRLHAAAILGRRGVYAIDAAPAQLTAAIVHRFRTMRREGRV